VASENRGSFQTKFGKKERLSKSTGAPPDIDSAEASRNDEDRQRTLKRTIVVAVIAAAGVAAAGIRHAAGRADERAKRLRQSVQEHDAKDGAERRTKAAGNDHRQRFDPDRRIEAVDIEIRAPETPM
jgi:uncharacterized protein HemX